MCGTRMVSWDEAKLANIQNLRIKYAVNESGWGKRLQI